MTFCIAGDNPDLFTVKVNYGGEWLFRGNHKEYVNGKVAFFDGLSVETFSRLELDAIPSHIGVPLPVGFMYRKPGRRLEDKMDRIVRDAEAYQFGKDAAARVDRTGEIWLVLPDIPKPKPPTPLKPCLLPWTDSPSAYETNMPNTQGSQSTTFCLEPLNFDDEDLLRIDELVAFSQSEFTMTEDMVSDNEGEASQFFPNFDGPYDGDNEEDLDDAHEVYIIIWCSQLFYDSILQLSN